MIDVDSEDEVTTKKKVAREASKKTPKEAKKKVTQKKAIKKKKGAVTKRNLKDVKKACKNVKVNYVTRGVASRNLSLLKPSVKPIPNSEEFTYLDPVQQHFPDPVPWTTASPPKIKKPSTSPKKPFVKTFSSFTKNFHGSIQINCRYSLF